LPCPSLNVPVLGPHLLRAVVEKQTKLGGSEGNLSWARIWIIQK